MSAPAQPSMHALLRPALILFGVLSVLTGLVYPALVTSIAQRLLPHQANGSLVEHAGRIVGSRLIGQAFSDPGHFWGRPSATGTAPYDATASGGSNLGPTNPLLLATIQDRIAALGAAHPRPGLPIPVDIVTASASGLDPHISPAAARWQVPRVASARGMPESALLRLVAEYTEGSTLRILGAPRVNVLALNLALDR